MSMVGFMDLPRSMQMSVRRICCKNTHGQGVNSMDDSYCCDLQVQAVDESSAFKINKPYAPSNLTFHFCTAPGNRP